jgi:SNF2 family DNA or RNA helicase
VDPAAAPLALWRVEALFLDVESAGTLLAGLPHGAGAELDAAEGTSWSGPSHTARALLGVDARFWSAAAKLVLDLLARQRFLPGVSRLPDAPGGYDPYDGYYGYSHRPRGPRLVGAWFAALGDPQDRARFDALAAAMPGLCRASVPAGLDEPDPETVPGARALLEDFAHCVVNARVQRWIGLDRLDLVLGGPADDPYHRYDVGLGYYGARPLGSLTERWLRGLQVADVPIYTTAAEASELQEGIRRWHAGTSGVDGAAFRLCFRLAPPDAPPEEVGATGTADADLDAAEPAVAAAEEVAPDDGAAAAAQPPRLLIERPGDAPAHAPEIADALAPDAPVAGAAGDGGSWRLDYLLQARDDPSLLVPLAEVWRARGSSARFLDRRFDRPHERVLASLGQAAHLCEPIAVSLGQAHPVGCDLDGAAAYRFLREALPLLEEAGFGVLVPSWWRRVAPRPTVRLRLRGPQKTSSGLLGLDAVLGYDWRLALGDQELSPEDLERLVALKEPLVRVRGQWVELRPEQVEAALAFARAHPGGRLSLGEALRASLTGELGEGEDELAVEEVRADEWIGDLLGRLRSGEALAEVPPPAALHGTLRPYQLRGLGWLAFLSRYGLGSCLADDMGLGKTVQLLTLMLHAKAEGSLTKPVLLVCPTSVVGNWRHETARFAPDLRLLVHHGAGRVGRAAAARFAAEVASYDLVVTTYSLLHRDEQTLATADWGAVVLDEAQNVKNVEAKQSRSARRLRAPVRVALTGTPVENRLAELWSIMDFLNPGYLGSHRRFHEQFAGPIERLRDPQATGRLQALVRPFVLRRLKTDPAVISDLPEKLEMREYVPLTREQVTLYEAVVRDGLRQIEEAESPMQRRGIVLAMLTKLKQVCNHPAHFLGDDSALAGRSGKLTRLEELIEELRAEGDRALIFTQFTAMGDRLRPYLQERFDTEVLYLHGAVPLRQREQLVALFQAEDGPPLFLLSLKAGGTGLNLTRANHVIHFDRWWNPAVENQATDRAFRIGQTRNVQVRKFVCTGTLEERIDAMIEQKRELAEKVIGTGEEWITEMSTDQLRELFSLRADALAD